MESVGWHRDFDWWLVPPVVALYHYRLFKIEHGIDWADPRDWRD
jgi:hypothetical protein